MRVLVADKIADEGVQILKKSAEVDIKTGLNESELMAIMGDYDALIVRSQTQVTQKMIELAHKLKIIGRAGVGTDNIDVAAATKKGIIVINSPEGNTIAAAEHTFALILSMARNIPQAAQSMREGRWDRGKFVGTELYGKVLGVIGLGKIGSRLASYGVAFGMQVMGYDPYATPDTAAKLGIQLKTVDEIISESDFISLHVPKTQSTENLINIKSLKQMKKTARIVNCARGGIVNEADLAEAIEKGVIAGAALDVFSAEPALDLPIAKLPSVICTPHLGASTEEAQLNVAIDVAYQISEVLQGKDAKAAVNIPALNPKLLLPVKKYFSMAEKVALLAGQLSVDPILELKVEYSGEVAAHDISPLNVAVQKGFLEAQGVEGVNLVNASLLLSEKGIRFSQAKSEKANDYANLITVQVITAHETRLVSACYFESVGERIVSIDGFKLQLEPQGFLIIVPNLDKPGIVGEIGTLLAKNHINIAAMIVGRESIGGNAVTVLTVDSEVPSAVIDQISRLALVRAQVRLVRFPK